MVVVVSFEHFMTFRRTVCQVHFGRLVWLGRRPVWRDGGRRSTSGGGGDVWRRGDVDSRVGAVTYESDPDRRRDSPHAPVKLVAPGEGRANASHRVDSAPRLNRPRCLPSQPGEESWRLSGQVVIDCALVY